MEKLELKHLVGYFPYGLKFHTPLGCLILNVISSESKYKLWFKFSFNSKNKHEEYNYQVVKPINSIGKGYMMSEVKPILRPLSDLTKEIEINGKKFVPISEIDEFVWDKTGFYYYGKLKNLSLIDWSDAPFYVIQKFLEWHFDIHGLIEKELAININTIKP